jgi:hypothetical protein
MKKRMLLPAILLLAASCAEVHAAVLHPFRGVVGVRVEGDGGFLRALDRPVANVDGQPTAEAEMGDSIVLRVRELDGWLIFQMQNHWLLGEKYFTQDQFHRWLELVFAYAKHPGNKERFGQWVQAGLADPKNPDLDLFQAFDALRQEIWAGFYLVLGNGRLAQINAERPYDLSPHPEPNGITYSNVKFKLTFNPGDKSEWDKVSRGVQFRVPHAVRIGFDYGVAQFTVDTIVPEAMLPPATAMPPPADLPGGEPGPPGSADFLRNFCFIAYSPFSMAGGLFLVVLILIFFVFLAAKTGMVRDPNLPARADGRLQFSLSRCQMAFWFLLFVAAFFFLWVVTGQHETLTDQCLELLGISAGTTISSALISKGGPAQRGVVSYCPFKDGPRRFFWEILSDGGGRVTFYRFQMMVWTLVLGMVFIKSVAVSLAMPSFGSNELALISISAGTYLAFKFPEQGGQKKAEEGAE